MVLFPLLVLAAGENLLNDAGFEEGLDGASGGWIPFDGSRVSTNMARNGSQSMFSWGYSRTVAYPPYFIGAVSGAYQELAASPGSKWRLMGYGATLERLEGSPAFGIVQVSFFDADGKDIGTQETTGEGNTKAKISNEVNTSTPAGEWVFLDTGIATAPPGTAAVQAFTLFVDYSGSNKTQGVYFDDLTLCQVDARAGETDCK